MQGYEGAMMSNIHYTRVGSSNGWKGEEQTAHNVSLWRHIGNYMLSLWKRHLCRFLRKWSISPLPCKWSTGILACGPLRGKVKSLFTNCSGGLLSLCSYYITQDKQWTYHVTLMRVRVTNVAVKKKAISFTCSESLSVTFLIPACAVILLPPVSCPPVPYFSTLSHKRHDFRKKKNYWK